jgi:DNA-binding PadR family transcriptional regulator
MADPPVLDFAILGLLAGESLSGYDIASRMQKPVGFFWTANHSQIYPALAKLHDSGWVTYRSVRQSDRPDKKVYAITDRGRHALLNWLTRPLSRQPLREELLVRAYFAWLADPSDSAAFFREKQREAESDAELFAGKLADYALGDGSPPPRESPAFGAYTTLKYGRDIRRAIAEWCCWMADSLSPTRPKALSRRRRRTERR